MGDGSDGNRSVVILLRWRRLLTSSTRRSAYCSCQSMPLPGVAATVESFAHCAPFRLNRSWSPLLIPDLATAFALEPWK